MNKLLKISSLILCLAILNTGCAITGKPLRGNGQISAGLQEITLLKLEEGGSAANEPIHSYLGTVLLRGMEGDRFIYATVQVKNIGTGRQLFRLFDTALLAKGQAVPRDWKEISLREKASDVKFSGFAPGLKEGMAWLGGGVPGGFELEPGEMADRIIVFVLPANRSPGKLIFPRFLPGDFRKGIESSNTLSGAAIVEVSGD